MKKTALLCVMMVTTLLLAGCNLQGAMDEGGPSPNLDPVATGDTTITQAPEQTSPPQQAPTPTPPSAPSDVLRLGERQLHNGDWENAAISFRMVIDASGATPEDMATAKLGLAQAALRQGDYGTALSTLDDLLTSSPPAEVAARALFLRGETKLGLADWAGAIADFEQYITQRPGLIDSYAYERIGDAYIAQEQYDAGLAAYEQAINNERYLVGTLVLRERVASINRSLGNVDAAIAQYDAILSVAQNDGYRASIEFLKGQTLFEAGREAEAYEQFLLVFNTYPFTYDAFSSLIALLEGGIDVASYQRGLVNYNNANYEPALTHFLEYVAQVGLEYPPDVHLYIADSYAQLGNIESAETEYQALINRFRPDNGAAWGTAHVELADLIASAGRPDEAYAVIDTFVADYPTLDAAPEALHTGGLIAERQGDLPAAGRYYQQLSTEYGDPRGARGLFRVGFAAYQAGDLASAEGFFGRASQQPSNEQPTVATYWLAKTLIENGRQDEAAPILQNVVALEPNSYYGLRAADLLNGTQPFTPTAGFTLPTDLSEGRAEADQWLISTFGLEPTTDTNGLPGIISTSSRFQRAVELWELGLETDARTDFEAIRQEYSGDPLATYQLAIYFRDIGLYRSSILATRTLTSSAGVHPTEAPVFIGRLAYPTYFADLVVQGAEQYGLDPLYVFALIYQESLFEGFAQSSASAQGLMQIWPPTGEDIAQRISWPNYRVSELQRPIVSVTFGTWLLNEEAKRFDGNRAAMLAAYNAGPGNTARWDEQSGGDIDAFLQVMTLNEPRLYVQLIYAHHEAYQALYGDE